MTPVHPFTPVNFLIMVLSTCHNHVSPLRSGSSSIAVAAVCSRPLSGVNQASVRWRSFWLYPQAILCFPCSFACHPLAALSTEAKLVFILYCFHRLPRSPDHPAPPAMPKLRQWMSCRRGSSRGQIRRQVASSMTNASTSCPDFRADRYPATRSGRGRGRGLQIIALISFQSMTNTARLRFHYSHGTSSFMAMVTIELSELNSGQGTGSLRATSNRPVEDKPGPIQTNLDQRKASGSGKGKASQSMKNQAGSSDDDDDYKYGCHITKEPPDPPPDA